MYLDFIIDIAEIGNFVIVKTHTETIEGTIVKLSKDLIAIQTSDGSVIVKKDLDILNIEIQPTKCVKENILHTTVSNKSVRCVMTLIKNDTVASFTCSICGKLKTSKKYAIKSDNPNAKICNSCYGWTLSKIENK